MKDDIMIPQAIRDRIKTAYNQLGLEEEQPVKKIPLHVYYIEDHLMINEVVDTEDGEDGNATAAISGFSLRREEAQTMLIRINRLEQKLDRYLGSIQVWLLSELRAYNGQMFRLMNNNI